MTDHGGRRTVWTVVARDERSARYARMPARSLGRNRYVRRHEDADGSTRVTVAHEPTAPSDDGRRELEEFERGYEGYIAAWGRLTEAAVASGA